MKFSKSRLAERRGERTVQHPMLAHGAGIATLAVACNSAANAVALTVIMLVLSAAMSVVYMFERGEYIQPMRTVIYFVPSAIITCGCGFVLNSLFQRTVANLGMYLPILAADALILAWLEEDAPFVPPTQALPAALRLWWLYAALALPIGALREILGAGRIFGHSIPFIHGISAVSHPFAGFIMLGFGLAIVQKLRGDEE
jgi:electron transport complex protein RnfE